MSLDVYLSVKREEPTDCDRATALLRANGFEEFCWELEANHEHGDIEMYEDNITHNLGEMAGEAGIYKHLWRPEEVGVVKAEQLIEPLKKGLSLLESDRSRFEKLNPSNGWGDYDGLVRFVQCYLSACIDHPEADVGVSR